MKSVPPTAVALNGAGAVAAAEMLACDAGHAPDDCPSGAAWIDAPHRCRVGGSGRPLICVTEADTVSRAGTAAGLAMAGLRSAGFDEGVPAADLGREVHRFARRGVPFVLNVTCGPTTSGPFSLVGRAGSVRSTPGPFLVHGRNPQQAADLCLIAHRLAEVGLMPGIHAMDADRVAGRIALVQPPDPELVGRYLGRPEDRVPAATDRQRSRYGDTRRRVPDVLEHDGEGGTLDTLDPALWEDDAALVVKLAEGAFEEFSRLTGRAQGPVECHAMDDAEFVLLGTGPRMEEAIEAADVLRRATGRKVGVVNITLLSPFPREAVRRALTGKTAATVILEEGDASSSTDAPLWLEVQAALDSPAGDPPHENGAAEAAPLLLTAVLTAKDRGPTPWSEIVENMAPEGARRARVAPAGLRTAGTPAAGAGPALTVRVDAPGDWSVSLLARLLTTLARIAPPLRIVGGRCAESWSSRTPAVAAVAADNAWLELPEAESDILVLPAPVDFSHIDPLPPVACGGVVLVQTPGGPPDRLWSRLAPALRQAVTERGIRVVALDARDPEAAVEDAGRLADTVSAAFEGAMLGHTEALARLGVGEVDWREALAGDALADWRERGAKSIVEVRVTPEKEEAGPSIRREDDIVDPRPRLPAAREIAIGEEEFHAFWSGMHLFYRTGRGGRIGTTLQGAELYPASLAPFRDMTGLRYAYPVWVAEPGENVPDPMVLPLSDLLREAATAHAPAESMARTLKENLPRLEQRLRDRLDGDPAAHAFRPMLEDAIRAMLDELAIPGEEGKALAADVEGMLARLPTGGHLIGYSSAVPFILLRACLDAVHSVRLRTFRTETANLRARLRDLLEVEEVKSAATRRPEQLVSAFGDAGDFFNAESFSRILPRRSASETMSTRRLERIRGTEATLAAFEEDLSRHHGLLLRPEGVDVGAPESDRTTPWVLLPDADSCSALTGVFEGHMAAMARWFAAAHVARLEIQDAYDEAIHDDYFADFDWRNFTREELALAAPVVLVDAEERLARDGLHTLSRLLLSGRPAKVLILHRRTEPHTGEFEAGEDPCRGAGQPGFHFRRELEHLAVAHPETFVLQSSPVDPQHLALGLRRGLESARPAVFRVFAPQTVRAAPDHTHPFVRAGAARDGRDFPLYTFGPHATRAWGDRFEAGGNPEPDRDWPTYSLDILDEHGEAATLTEAFTFADFAAQDPVFFGLLRSVPRPFWNDDMVPLADYLALDPEHGAMKVPYLWMVDGDNVLQRVVPAHALVLACQDRLNHWHILQELGGIRNTHAERAAREAEERVRAEAGREIEALQAEHAAELERVRRETAGEAMDKLSRVLLELDLEAAAPSVARAVPAAARARPAGDGAATGTAPAVEEEPEPEEAISEDPWIETFRCTSCNECININPLLFQYNADKLATIANSRAGTYADLVAAAEKCPARCIHPGKPLDTSEPNLEALMKRAEKFN